MTLKTKLQNHTNKLKNKLQGYVNTFSDTVESFTHKHTERFFKSPEQADKFAKTTGAATAGAGAIVAMTLTAVFGGIILGAVGGSTVVMVAPSLLSTVAHTSIIGTTLLAASAAYISGKVALNCVDTKLPRSEKGLRNSMKGRFKSIKKNAIQKPALFAAVSVVGLTGAYALDTVFSAPGNSSVDKFNNAVEQQKEVLSKMAGVQNTPSTLKSLRAR